MSRSRALLCLVVLASGCTSYNILSDGGQVRVALTDLRSVRYMSHRASMPVLQHSKSSLSFTVEGGGAECFDASVTGALRGQSDLTFDQAGSVDFTFTPTGCEDLPEAVPDGLSLQTIDASTVEGRVALPGIEYGLRELGREGVRLAEPDEVPEGIVPESGELLVLVAGVATPLEVALTSGGQPVLVGPGSGFVNVSGDASFSPEHPLWGVVLPNAPGEGEISFVTEQRSVAVAPYEAVEPSDVRRLRAAVVMERDEEASVDHTAGVAVWAEDRSGRRIYNLPLEIEVRRGPLVLPEYGPPGPWLFQPSLCVPPWELAGQVVERRVRFRFDNRTVDVDLSYDMTELDPSLFDDERETWHPAEECVNGASNAPAGGCGCSSSTSPPLGALLIAGLLGWVRRRGSRRPR